MIRSKYRRKSSDPATCVRCFREIRPPLPGRLQPVVGRFPLGRWYLPVWPLLRRSHLPNSHPGRRVGGEAAVKPTRGMTLVITPPLGTMCSDIAYRHYVRSAGKATARSRAERFVVKHHENKSGIYAGCDVIACCGSCQPDSVQDCSIVSRTPLICSPVCSSWSACLRYSAVCVRVARLFEETPNKTTKKQTTDEP